MGAIVLALTWACATGIITTASRMTWSFARDKGTPWATIINTVSKRRRIPVIAVVVVTTLAALLNLIYIGSSTAFNDVISLTITGFYCSYFLPAALLLYHRVKGHIAPHEQDTPGVPIIDDSSPSPPRKPLDPNSKHDQSPEPGFDEPASAPALPDRRASVAQASLVWGPFHVPGLFGTLNNAYACVYMIFVIFWSVWPPVTPVSADT
jgi:choline transport protein